MSCCNDCENNREHEISTSSGCQFAVLPDEILENILRLLVHSLPKHERCSNPHHYHHYKDKINEFPSFKDFLVLCQLNSRIRNHIRSSVYLNTLLLSWSGQSYNEMIPLWVSKSQSKIVCGLLTEVILISNCYGLSPSIEASNIAPLFRQCRNLKILSIRNCLNFSLPELMLLLHEDEEIVCDLDMLELNPQDSIKGRKKEFDRDGSKTWAQAMLYFKQIFQARNREFFLNPEVCPCGEGILRRREKSSNGKRDTSLRNYICDRCDKIIPECCGFCFQDLGIQRCQCSVNCCHDFACKDCAKTYACQKCGKYYSHQDSSLCTVKGCNSLLCHDCGMGKCDCGQTEYCPVHNPFSWCDSKCSNTSNYCSECEVGNLNSCEKCGIKYCTEHAFCPQEHECDYETASECDSA